MKKIQNLNAVKGGVSWWQSILNVILTPAYLIVATASAIGYGENWFDMMEACYEWDHEQLPN